MSQIHFATIYSKTATEKADVHLCCGRFTACQVSLDERWRESPKAAEAADYVAQACPYCVRACQALCRKSTMTGRPFLELLREACK
ncbi:hypothetical protein IT575_12060 [bacterium]|nr:hypothetical protein [bacterium]